MKIKKRLIIIVTAFIVIAALTCTVAALLLCDREVELPILMYHHINETGDKYVTISTSLFETHIKYLVESGYHPVSFDEVIGFVEEGKKLPDKPVCIVFDDGYESNYLLGYPILKKYEAKATIFVIGSSVGKSTYKNTEHPIIPHFSWDEAREMVDSGLISIQTHTYDMHMCAPYETGDVRENVLPLVTDTAEAYAALLTDDYQRNAELIRDNLGYDVTVFAYPNGKYYDYSESIIRSLGARVTLTTRVGTNLLQRGNSESLYLLNRYTINQNTDLTALQSYLDGVIPK